METTKCSTGLAPKDYTSNSPGWAIAQLIPVLLMQCRFGHEYVQVVHNPEL